MNLIQSLIRSVVLMTSLCLIGCGGYENRVMVVLSWAKEDVTETAGHSHRSEVNGRNEVTIWDPAAEIGTAIRASITDLTLTAATPEALDFALTFKGHPTKAIRFPLLEQGTLSQVHNFGSDGTVTVEVTWP